MFKINYQITYKPEELKLFPQKEIDRCYIEGNIEIEVNTKKYGYYKNEPLAPGEEGWDLLTIWFEELVDVLVNFKNGHDYVAIFVMDTNKTWLEFKRQEVNKISVSIISFQGADGHGLIITEIPTNIEAGDWSNEVITYHELKTEILLKVNDYISTLAKINKAFERSATLIQLKAAIDSI